MFVLVKLLCMKLEITFAFINPGVNVAHAFKASDSPSNQQQEISFPQPAPALM